MLPDQKWADGAQESTATLSSFTMTSSDRGGFVAHRREDIPELTFAYLSFEHESFFRHADFVIRH